jgi:hypothetical protein
MKPYRRDYRILSFILIVGLAALVPACNRGPSRNVRLQREYNACCKEAADLLAGVTDVPTARAAEPRLKVVLRRWVKVNEQLEASYDSSDVSPRERDAMLTEVGQGIAEIQRLNVEMLRISKLPDVFAALGETGKQLPSFPMLGAAGAIPNSK